MSKTKPKEIETLTQAIEELHLTLQPAYKEQTQPPDEAAYAALEAQLLAQLRPIEAEAIWQETKTKLLATLTTEGLVNQQAYTSQILSRAKRRIRALAQAANERQSLTQEEPAQEITAATAQTATTTEAVTTAEPSEPKQEPQDPKPKPKAKPTKPKKTAASKPKKTAQ